MENLEPPELYKTAGKLRKKKTQLQGDIHPAVVTKCADLLVIPLCFVYAEVFRSCTWPDQWKKEMDKIIPKNQAPQNLGETRNILCTPFLSKMLEALLLEILREQVSLSTSQFGGIKGLGVDHFLVGYWGCLNGDSRSDERIGFL